MTGREVDDTTASRCGRFAVAWLCLAWVCVTVPGVRTSLLRPLAVYPTMFLLPGYAVLAAMDRLDTDRFQAPELSVIERLVFAVALSLAVTILVGVSLLLTVEVSPVSALATLSLIILIGVGPTLFERNDESAFALHWPTKDWLRAVKGGIDWQSVTSSGGAPVLAVAALVAAGGVAGLAGAGYLTLAHDQPGYAEFATLPADGSALSEGSTVYEAGDAVEIRLTNHYAETATFTIVPIVQQMAESEPVRVVDARSLDPINVTLAPDERWTENHRPAVPWRETAVRITYELHRDDAGSETPQTRTHLWIERGTDRSTNETGAMGSNGGGYRVPPGVGARPAIEGKR